MRMRPKKSNRIESSSKANPGQKGLDLSVLLLVFSFFATISLISQRIRDPVLSDQVEVGQEEQHDAQREYQYVESVESGKSGGSDLAPANEHLPGKLSYRK